MKHASLQTKFSMSYIAIIVAVLALMNTYPLTVSEDLVFRSKEATLKSAVSVMTTALTGLAELNEENVAAALTVAEEAGVSRVLVTDAAGRVLYDTSETDGAAGHYASYTEIAQALRGNDVFTVAFTDGAFQSRCASPVIYRSQTIGAVYAYEHDVEQAALLQNLQNTLLRISETILVAVILSSLVLSRALTRRFSLLAGAIRQMREGDYDHRARVGGHDEITEIAGEFNSLADRLQSTEEVRRRFVADASHELKTPLAGIRLLSDSILQNEDMDKETVREFVGDIEQESERLTRITEDLLRLTRLDSGTADAAEPIDLARAVERAVHTLTLVAREREVALSYEIARGAFVLATEDEARQIVYNLTENGIKYNHAGGFVRVRLAGDDDDAVLTVEDNGIGIPDEDLPRVFDRFYRVDKMRSRDYGGTGLGLSIVSDTVHRRGGTVSAAARQGGGSVFTVRLPRAGAEGGGTA